MKAKPYLDKAVAAKVKGAEVLLAYSYQHHFNDEKEAYRLIKDSKNESSLSYCVLGELFYSGKFLNRDYKKAYEFINLVRNDCFNNAKKFYEEYIAK